MGRVWPNPAVGCVLVQGDRIVGRGWTQDGGRPHAEPMALAQAGNAARGATAYVTLEPCAHHGKTPPCAEALIKAGIARVVTALEDPDPRVSGSGHAMLRAAGISVTRGVLQKQAARDHAGFLSRVTKGRPFLTLKLASSFDGRIATATGESKWITGPDARRMVHMLRARHDAVLVGGGTARADDPALTIRDLGITRQPMRIIVSRRLDLPLDGILARTATETPVLLCHGPDADPLLASAWTDLGAALIECPVGATRHLDPDGMLQALGRVGLTRVFCEGGGALAASLLRLGLVDEVIGFTAGVMLGAEGRPALGAMGIDSLAQAPHFDLVEVRAIGGDILHRWAKA